MEAAAAWCWNCSAEVRLTSSDDGQGAECSVCHSGAVEERSTATSDDAAEQRMDFASLTSIFGGMESAQRIFSALTLSPETPIQSRQGLSPK
jgi:hypothetical protein